MSGTATLPAERADADPRLLRAVFGATFCVRFGCGLSLATFAAYLTGRSTGISVEGVGTVGLVASLSPIGEFGTVLLLGLAADRYGRLRVLQLGMLLAGGVLLAASFTRVAEWLGGLNFIFGIASGAILASSLAVIADRAERSARGLEMGRFDAMNLMGWVLGFALGYALLDSVANTDLVWVFRAASAALFAGLVFVRLSFRGARDPAGGAILGWRTLVDAIRRREVLLVTLPWLVIYLLLGTLFVFLGSAATGAGLAARELAVLIGAGGLVLLATQPTFGRLADRFGRLRLMTIGTVGFVGVLAGGGLLATYGARPELLVLTGVSALAALAYGPAALAALTDLSEAISRATTMALYTLVISLGMFLGLGLSSGLYSALGTLGLDLYFAGIAVSLVGLTVARVVDQRHGRFAQVAGPAPRR